MKIEIMEIDNKKYGILNEVEDNGTTYIYLSNIDNPDDVMIRKSSKTDKELYIPLENEDEFFLANLLLFKGNKKSDQ